jgi:hypothetical protein
MHVNSLLRPTSVISIHIHGPTLSHRAKGGGMPTQKDLLIGTTLHHLKQFADGPPQPEQKFISPIPLPRAKELAASAMRTAARFASCLSMNVGAKQIHDKLLSWYGVSGEQLIRKWQAESKCDAELISAAREGPDLYDSFMDRKRHCKVTI